jgi:hypothetical protein
MMSSEQKLKLGQCSAPGSSLCRCLVTLCQKGNAEAALDHMRRLMDKPKLTVNEGKTRIRKVPERMFDFLVYLFGA